MNIATADLMDNHPNLPVLEPIMQDFGGKAFFCGQIKTISCFEDNTKVRERLETEDGTGKVLVIDGGASKKCALVGDNIALLAIKNNWAGIIVNGCIRDSQLIGTMDIGLKALATMPRKSIKSDQGFLDVEVYFGGVRFVPNEYIYCDTDGVVVSKDPLH